jgi:hypothetical protein
MTLNTIRRMLYRLASGIGDYQALRKGPTALLKRLVRKRVWWATGRVHRRWLP